MVPMLTPSPGVATRLHAAYASQINRPQYRKIEPLRDEQRVDIAIIDNAPKEETSGLPSGGPSHGFSMATLARENSCYFSRGTALDCPAYIRTYDALKEGNGGHGYISDVALAVREALEFKQKGQRNMIINLSLGWDPVYARPVEPGQRMAERALFDVLDWATCSGALVVAASGNRSSYKFSHGPTFPGGWEGRARSCDGPEYRPVLYAAGGVQGDDEELGIATPKGSPRVVAPASFISAQNLPPVPGGPTEMLTGTSLASAGVAGLAAHLWSHDPNATADKIMAVIYRKGVPLKEVADFQFGGATYKKSRIDACHSAQEICTSNCPQKCEPPRPAGSNASPDFSTLFPGGGRTVDPHPTGISAIWAPPFPMPWAGPQPGRSGCPGCGVNNNELVGEVDMTLGEISGVIFRPTCTSGATCTDVAIDHTMLGAAGEFVFPLPGGMTAGSIDSAFIEVVVDPTAPSLNVSEAPSLNVSEAFIQP